MLMSKRLTPKIPPGSARGGGGRLSTPRSTLAKYQLTRAPSSDINVNEKKC